ncbi:MAG: acyltransferase [Mediterranea sp.]|jgi:peptidoglycan/LPS O-acetylase OafA/YrhL|nr:acyltransferase [Mediterranea sp.]
MEIKIARSTQFVDTKPHYSILDGLRGVAAVVVLCFHISEAFATSHLDYGINHGYLAVDLFFILSGFVMGYAYDDRRKTMTVIDFIKRRMIRLHPMVVMGAVIGAALFYFQDCAEWVDVSMVTVTTLLVATALSALLLPATPSAEVRGLGEMFPLNGPSWSLFFEYIGNLLYILFIRRLSTKVLAGIVFMAGCGLATFAIAGPHGDICVGFALTGMEFTGGILRLLFSFSAGLLIARIFKSISANGSSQRYNLSAVARIFKPISAKRTFWICSLSVVALLSVPRIGGAAHLWMNGIYETACCVVFFPLIICFGVSSGKEAVGLTGRICTFLGDISYPLYMVHYPFIYLYYAWVKNGNLTFSESLPGAIAVVVGSILLAYICLKLYDIPLRRFLANRFLKRKQ